MTRINVVPVEELSRQHLIAEYRELPRLFALIRKAIARGDDPKNYPRTYRLGPGHVKFFYNKLPWLVFRHLLLVGEMQARGYKPKYLFPDLTGLPHTGPWCLWYTPDAFDMGLNRARIAERSG